MTFKTVISVALQASLFLLVLSLGLQSRWADVLHILRRPALFFRAILAVNVIVPAIVISLCLVLPVAPWTKAALVMMGVSPLAPFAPVKMLKGGAERSYVIGLFVALMLAAVLIVPATAEMLKPLAPRGVAVPVPLVAAFVANTVLVPLLIGVAISSASERFAKRIAPVFARLALAVILPAALLILLRFTGDFMGLIGDGTLAVIAATVAAGLLSGYALGGPEPANRKALGDAAATRHPGLAAMIAQLHSNDARVLSAIALFLFASIVFSTAFRWLISLRPVGLRHSHPVSP